MIILVFLLTATIALVCPTRAQEILPPVLKSETADTVSFSDTLSTAQDTLSVTGVDTVINYTSRDSIIYSIPTKMMSLYEKGEINYQDMQLKAARIDIDWNTSILTARGVPDSTDTTGMGYRGSPEMKDGNEEYKAFELGYNFQTKKGRINLASTTIDQGYYHGDEIKKVGQNTLFISNGRYTTCDLPDPHYYFSSPKMMVVPQEKIVGEPIYLYVADVPVFALPFGVFPNQRGRRSGIIAPAYGEDGRRGRFLRHLGYYWAISDYMDANVRTDLYTKGGWAVYSAYRYALRYNFNGSLSGEYKRLHTGEADDPRRTENNSYQVGMVHNQEFDPTTRLNVNFTFASNNSYLNTIDLNQALNQFITSNATLSRSWEGTPNSVTLNVSRSQNLLTGNIDETLPSISFNHSQSYPFRWGKDMVDEESLSWYENIGFSYSATASNRRSKVLSTIDGIKVNVNGLDTVHRVEEFARSREQSLTQSTSLNIAPKLGHITISPSLSYRDERSFKDSDVPLRTSPDSMLAIGEVKESRRAGFFSSGVSASTKLYGILQPGILGVQAFRHTVTPGLSFRYDKQIVGRDPIGKQMTLGLNVGNIFEIKTQPADEQQEPRRIQLLNLNADVAYNFSVDSLNFSPIGISYRTSIGSLLDVGGSASYDLYKLEEVSPGVFTRVNKFLISEEGRLARLTDFRISLSTSLSGERRGRQSGGTPIDTAFEGQAEAPVSAYGYRQPDEEPDFSIPWRLGLTLDYAERKVPPSTSRSANVRGNLEFNLTEAWKISMSGGYDIVNRQVVVPNVNISRDLHCWIMNFSWIPLGTYRSYQLEIRVKAPQLQDLKVTKSGSERGIY